MLNEQQKQKLRDAGYSDIDIIRYENTKSSSQQKQETQMPILTNEQGGFGTALKDVAVGAGKSFIRGARDVAGMVQGLGKSVLNKISPMENVGIQSIDDTTQSGQGVKQMLEPKSQAQKVGGYLETAGELATGFVKGVKPAYRSAKTALQARGEAKAGKEIIEEITPRLSPKEYKEAAKQGQVKSPSLFSKGGLEGEKIPTIVRAKDTIYDVAKSLNKKATDIINTKSGNIANNMKSVGNATVDYAKNVVRPFLQKNPTPFNFADLQATFRNVSPRSSLGDKEATSAYNKVGQRLLDVIGNTIKKTGRVSPIDDFNDIWNSRKAMDKIIREELGDKVFDSSSYKGVKAAAQDFRSAFRQFLSDSFKYKGQMDKVAKMNDFIKVSKQKGIEISDEMLPELKKQFGIIEDMYNQQISKQWDKYMENLNNMFDIVDNLASKVGTEKGKTKIGVMLEKYPKTAKTIKYGSAGVAGAGLTQLIND